MSKKAFIIPRMGKTTVLLEERDKISTRGENKSREMMPPKNLPCKNGVFEPGLSYMCTSL